MNSSKKIVNKKVIFSALLCMFAFIYVIHHIGNAFKEKTELFTVTRETLENTVDLSGYIFREDTVLGGAGFLCSYNFDDGEKVAKNASVANIFYSENEVICRKYEELRKKIDVLEKSTSLLHIDIQEVDKEIAELRTKIAVYSAQGDLSFLEEAEEELLVLLHKRSLAEQNKSGYEAELFTLRAELTSLKTSVGSISVSVNAPCSGYFYSYTDGLEALFTAEAAKSMSFELFESLCAAEAQKSAGVGKIASVGKWYFVCKTTAEAAEEIVADEKYSGVFCDNSFGGSLPLLAEQKLIDYASGSVLLVFSSTHVPENFDFSRMQRLKLTVAHEEGLRVPSESVRVTEEGQTIVYIIKEGICRPRNVNIIFEKGGYCVVSEPQSKSDLALYDRIIIGEAELYDGKVIDY